MGRMLFFFIVLWVGWAMPALAADGSGASEIRYGAREEDVLSIEPGGVTYLVGADYEVQDGLGVVYVRQGLRRVARTVSVDLAARIYPDLAPRGVPDGIITAGDAFLARSAPAPIDRMLLSSARRLLYGAVPVVTWPGRDHISSVTAETDHRGGLIGRRAYAPFGSLIAALGDMDRYGFTNRHLDLSGILRFRFRQLDTATGRWVSPDPLFGMSTAENMTELGESATAYTYVANSPSGFVDTTGLKLLAAVIFDRHEHYAVAVRDGNKTIAMLQLADGKLSAFNLDPDRFASGELDWAPIHGRGTEKLLRIVRSQLEFFTTLAGGRPATDKLTGTKAGAEALLSALSTQPQPVTREPEKPSEP